jgi:hypothetical protein
VSLSFPKPSAGLWPGKWGRSRRGRTGGEEPEAAAALLLLPQLEAQAAGWLQETAAQIHNVLPNTSP